MTRTGSGSRITIIPGWHICDQNDTRKKLYAKPTTASLEVTMPPSKPTLKSHLYTTGLKFIKT
jgi:hypothetical protein